MPTPVQWRARDTWGGWAQALADVGIGAIGVFSLLRSTGVWWTAAFPVLAWRTMAVFHLRRRVRLTDTGVEVRGFSRRTYTWAEIEAVELAPRWDRAGVLLRLRGDIPHADPVRLPLPTGARGSPELDAAVAAIHARLVAAAAP